uniref:Ephrin RBD domain-containing protein n=1 Tax=Rhinopithecus bieti TaxID=61621 RepID=A0A2K6KC77_RHIBE
FARQARGTTAGATTVEGEHQATTWKHLLARTYGAAAASPAERMEALLLYMVQRRKGHASPAKPPPQRGFKFSEKFQLFHAFSLGLASSGPGHEYYYISATPPNAVDRPCLRLKVYVRPTNETLYEPPEPIFTSNNSCSSLGGCRLFLSTIPLLWTLLGS